MIFSTKRFGQGYFDSKSKHLFNSFQEGQAIVRSVTSRYHGSKISGSQQQTEGLSYIPESNYAQESHTCHFSFSFFCHICRSVHGLVSFRNYVTMGTLRNDFFPL